MDNQILCEKDHCEVFLKDSEACSEIGGVCIIGFGGMDAPGKMSEAYNADFDKDY